MPARRRFPSPPPGEQHTRREFFRRLGRNLALGAAAVVTGVLGARRRGATKNHACVNQGVCRGCPSFDGCGLPQALSAKQATRTS
jgi:hypothetical protein